MNFTEIDACVRSYRAEMIAFTTELVSIASENPPGIAYPACVRAITARLRALDLPCQLVKYRPAKGRRDDSGAAVVLSSVGSGQRTLYFSGHYDVVPVTAPGQCTPVLKGKTLFGRGSADMKSGLASMLYAAVALSLGCRCVTADRPFYAALAAPYPETMLWVEDIPETA